MIFIKFFIYTLEIDLPFLGLQKNHFGTCLLLDCTKDKVENLFWALSCLTNSNYVLVVNKPFKKAVPINGKPVIKKVLYLSFSLNYRIFNEDAISKIIKTTKDIWE